MATAAISKWRTPEQNAGPPSSSDDRDLNAKLIVQHHRRTKPALLQKEVSEGLSERLGRGVWTGRVKPPRVLEHLRVDRTRWTV